MNPTINAIRLGVARGWTEFKIFYLDLMQGLVPMAVLALLLVGVLWFQRDTHVGGVSLALLTLPGLLAMLLANEGFSSVARFLSSDKEDGTLLRAKALPQGMVGYLIGRVVLILLATSLDLVLVFVPSLFVVPGLLADIDAARLLTFGWVVVLGLLATAPMGAVIGSLVKSAGAGLGLTIMPLLALVAISGIFYPIRAFPVWVQWIAQVFPIYWIGLGLRSAFAPPAAAVVEIGGTYRPLITLLVLAAWSVAGLLLTPGILRRMAQRVTGSEIEVARQRRMVGGY